MDTTSFSPYLPTGVFVLKVEKIIITVQCLKDAEDYTKCPVTSLQPCIIRDRAHLAEHLKIVKNKIEIANSADSDEAYHNEPFHLILHWLPSSL